MSLLIASHAEPIPGYRLIDRLGSGGFGEVWKAEAPGGLLKAIKIIHGDLRTVDPDGARHAEQEMKALKRIQAVRHPYLLSLERYDVIEGRLLIVMELADCNLWDRFRVCRSQGLPGIPREEILDYLEESSEVLDLMSNQYGLQHLDIKPQNLFLVHNHVKVADFGLVKDLGGVRAAITGGVTPVYAAPETFEGIATRFCDQYSLAIVYQELLTGVRPFNGTNAQQLLMQHVQGLPNLTPLPPADRLAMGRALSKKPEDRFPTCMQFVRSLRRAGGDLIGGAFPGLSAQSPTGRIETPAGNLSTMGAFNRSSSVPFPPASPPPETPKTEPKFRREDATSSASIDLGQPAQEAPPEEIGTGALLPAVVVAIGQQGIEVVQNFRRQVVDRYGSFDRLAHLRIICIDTDTEALQIATSSNESSPLNPGEVIPMRLNRASHYLKPRRNGRSLIEGWFDAQMLYRIPRNPQTLGLRCLGRLAFCDHYRAFAAKLREELEACVHPEAIAKSDKHTRLGLRTNRPRVYIVVGLGGGTGGGMFIDIAYAARHRLKQMGYVNPEVVGLALLPPVDKNAVKPQTIGNAFAALKELNHFSLPETVFTASHDDKDGFIRDAAPPFGRFHIMPFDGPAPKPGEPPAFNDPTVRAADFLRRDLLSSLGRIADENRIEINEHQPPAPITASVPNRASFIWPKQDILSEASRWLGESLIARWTKADPGTIREPVRNWLKERWNAENFGGEALIAKLQQHSEKKIGQPLDALFAAEAQPFVPRGWFARDPEPAKLWQAVARLLQIVGMPDEHSVQRQIGQLEHSLSEAADELIRDISPRLVQLPRILLEHADYRVGGAEEAIAQLQGILTQLLEHYEPLAVDMANKSIDAFYVVNGALSSERGHRKPSPAEVAESLLNFPKWRFQSLLLRQVCRIYTVLRGHLADLTREVLFCRQRLEELMTRFRQTSAAPVAVRETTLFPSGCASVGQAVQMLRDSIQPEELRNLDKSLQKQIEQQYQALFSVCLSSINMLRSLQGVVEEQTRAFLSNRMGELHVGEMFLNRFIDADSSVRAIGYIHEQAAPPVKTSRPITKEICVVAIPDGELKATFQQLARQAMAGKAIDFTSSTEEILIYREWPQLPLTILPQLGPLAEDAYNQMQQAGQNTPHTRNDIGHWFDV